MLSRGKNRSIGKSFSPRWKTPFKKPRGPATVKRPRFAPKSIQKPEIRFSRLLLVVDQLENDATQITVNEARKKNPAAQAGDWIAETLPPFDFGRIAAQSAKQVIVQKVREAERDRQYEEYKDRIGDIVNGIVKRVEFGNVIIDLGRGEATIRRDEMIPREVFRPGDRTRAYVYEFAANSAGRRFFCRARIRNSWPNCFARKCRKSTITSSR